MLIGKSLILRPLKKSDLEKNLIWRNDLEIIKNAQLIHFPKTYEIDETWFDKVLYDTSNRNIYFGIEEIKTNEFIGIIQLNEIDWISRTCVWGFIIGEKNKRGLGYHIEAPHLLFDYAFNVLNLHKISSYAVAFNENTQIMHRQIGDFVEEGRMLNQVYLNKEYFDVIIYSIFNNSKKQK